VDETPQSVRAARAEYLHELLFRSGTPVFALLDAARDPGVVKLLETGDCPYTCLYAGHSGEIYKPYAPYLAQVAKGSRVLDTLLRKGWGQSVGYFIGSRAEPGELLTHLRKFLFVDLPGKERRAYFRFYDPRVMRAFLPTCSDEQLDDWLREHLEWFVIEAEEGAWARVFVRTTPERREAQGVSDRLVLTPIQLPVVPASQDEMAHAPDSRIAV